MSYCRLLRFAFLLFALPACTPEKERPLSEQFSGTWIHVPSPDIVRALVANKIRTCPYLEYRVHVERSSEYLAYCSLDGVHWNAYLVYGGVGRIEGPFVPDANIALPDLGKDEPQSQKSVHKSTNRSASHQVVLPASASSKQIQGRPPDKSD